MIRVGVAIVLLFAACKARPEVQPVDADPKKVVPQKWEPPEPNARDFDWIRVNTGEWIKGDIKALREKTFEFKSEKFKNQSFKWRDVHEIRSSRQNKVVRENQETVEGTLLMKGGTVLMKTESGDVRFSRNEIMSILPGGEKFTSLWTGRISLGATTRSGNTDQFETNAQVFFRRRSPLSRLDFDYIGNFGTLEGEATVDNHRFATRWDLFLSRRMFVTPASVILFRDRFQNIDRQVTPAAKVGYRIVDRPAVEWEVDLGAGWRFTTFESVSTGPSTEDTPALLPGTRFQWDLTSDIELEFTYRAQVSLYDLQDTQQNLLVKLEIDLFRDFDLDITFQWDHVGQPRPDSGGNTPEKDDFRLVVGIGWEF